MQPVHRILSKFTTPERSSSAAPGIWLRNNRKAKTGVACDVLFDVKARIAASAESSLL
jgi:hypothetical protein